MKVFSHPAITDVKDMRTLYPIAFSVDSKSYLVLSMNSNGQVLKQVVHKRKSCRGDWPKFTLPQSAPQSLSDMWRFSFEIGAAQLCPLQKSRRNHRSYGNPPNTVWFSFRHKSVNMTLYSHGLEAGGFWNDGNWLWHSIAVYLP